MPLPLSASSPGTTTGELLKIPVSARAIGMGEAYTAAADDSSSLYWNPAGLSFQTQKEAAFMHSSLLEGVHYEHLAFSAPGESFSLGTSISYLGYGSIPGYDNNMGTPIGDQSAYAYNWNGGIATLLGNRLSLGVTGTFLYEKLAQDSASTFAGNFGAIYEAGSHPLSANYRFGVSAQNIGPGLKFVSERDPLPQRYKVGASIEHLKDWPLNLTFDVTKPNDNDTYVAMGSEYWFAHMVALRLGYIGSNDEGKGLRLGLGLKLQQILFDYAYGSFGDFGATHRIELALRFGDRMRQMSKEQRTLMREAKQMEKEGDYAHAELLWNDFMEMDPTNDKVLRRMVQVHELMLRRELNDAIAQSKQREQGQTDESAPSPDEFALQDLVPGQQNLVANPGAIANPEMGGVMANPAAGVPDPNDPLGLNNLPDVKDLEAAGALPGQPTTNVTAVGPDKEKTEVVPLITPAKEYSEPKPATESAEPVTPPQPAAQTESSTQNGNNAAPAAPADNSPMINPSDLQ